MVQPQERRATSSWLSQARAAGEFLDEPLWRAQTEQVISSGRQGPAGRMRDSAWQRGLQSAWAVQRLAGGAAELCYFLGHRQVTCEPRGLAEAAAAPCVTLEVTGSYGICFRVERAVERVSPGQGCKIIAGWCSVRVIRRTLLMSHP